MGQGKKRVELVLTNLDDKENDKNVLNHSNQDKPVCRTSNDTVLQENSTLVTNNTLVKNVEFEVIDQSKNQSPQLSGQCENIFLFTGSSDTMITGSSNLIDMTCEDIESQANTIQYFLVLSANNESDVISSESINDTMEEPISDESIQCLVPYEIHYDSDVSNKYPEKSKTQKKSSSKKSN